ncbi:MAG TPA: hypothetical protein VMH28_26445 [Candidatus Acidoferrales bacterium]|nr:hypothetical protein [Candidatus Acidoferrales bacterium]
MRALAAVFVLGALAWGQTTRPAPQVRTADKGGRKVVEIEHQEGLYRGEKTPLPLTPLRDASRTKPAPATVSMPETFAAHFANPALNSRLPASLSDRKWSVAWKVSLEEHESPLSILRSADRILVRFANSFRLYDSVGKPVARGPVGAGAVYLDGPPGLFYVTTSVDTLEARRLSDGGVVFQTSIAAAPSLVYPLIARAANRLIIVGTQIQQFSHTPEPAVESVLQFKEFGGSLSVDDTGMLSSLARGGLLRVNSADLFSAVSGNAVHFAVPDALVATTTDLQVQSACGGKFHTKLMSADEAGNRYLLVDPGGRPALWGITSDCTRFFNVPLEPRYGSLVAPPVIGYDHLIYLVSGSWVLSLSPEGKILWERELPAQAAGTGVTSDHWLMVTAGDAVLEFARDGTRFELARLPGDALVTYPVLTAANRILAASAHTLYCLQPSAQ